MGHLWCTGLGWAVGQGQQLLPPTVAQRLWACACPPNSLPDALFLARPPSCTSLLSRLQDNLFRIFGGDRIQGLMSAFRIEDLPIESQMLTNALDEAQRKVRGPWAAGWLADLAGWLAGWLAGAAQRSAAQRSAAQWMPDVTACGNIC